jgi:hypothetical protein
VWTAGIIVALALLISFFGGYYFGWRWTGLVKDANFPMRTLWDWMKLLIIPAVLAGGGLWFNRQQREQEVRIAARQREQELEAADRRAQDEALQAYLDQLGQLLLNKEWPLRQSEEGDDVRTLARARTLTVLSRLDGDRPRSVVQFLYESGLITKDRAVLDLNGANLSRADLRGVDLPGADLRRAVLRGADLSAEPFKLSFFGVETQTTFSFFISKTNLAGADLRRADLRGADLRGAVLRGANLSAAILREANLLQADLSEADLSEANLLRANLRGANLRGANLRGARHPEAESLEGATMPNGQKYEEWLKDIEGSGKEGENSGPS